jgi:hypothetical protein
MLAENYLAGIGDPGPGWLEMEGRALLAAPQSRRRGSRPLRMAAPQVAFK